MAESQNLCNSKIVATFDISFMYVMGEVGSKSTSKTTNGEGICGRTQSIFKLNTFYYISKLIKNIKITCMVNLKVIFK